MQNTDRHDPVFCISVFLLESLEDAYLAPVTVLSNGDFDDVKDKFFQGDLSPARFLDELQRLLSRN